MEARTLPRVSIADQSAGIIERLAASLNGAAEVIGRATNAQAALEGIRSSKPHLAVVDVAIPDGIELLKQIKNHQPPVIVVVLTHSAEETTRRVSLRNRRQRTGAGNNLPGASSPRPSGEVHG